MPTIHRQLRDWCGRRNLRYCDDLATRLDDALSDTERLTYEVLLEACREVPGIFFRQNKMDREAIAEELAAVLKVRKPQGRLRQLNPNKTTGKGAPPDLFISYYHKDRQFVDRLSQDVAHHGYSVWYDRLGLTGGAKVPTEIEWALENAVFIGVVATLESQDRPWIRLEVDSALVREIEEGRDILVTLRRSRGKLRLFLRVKHWCDFVHGYSDGLECLLRKLSTAV